jgi:hypothetical protein
MNHSAIVSRLDGYQADINYLQNNRSGMPFIMSEVGSSIRGTDAYGRSLGAALWQVDFQLYAMSIGIARVHMQQALNVVFDMWRPVDIQNTTAQVFAPFYAQPFVADFIANTGGNTRVIHFYTGNLIGMYAAYDGNSTGPSRLAVVNFNFWRGNGTRPNFDVAFNDLGQNITSATVYHLTSSTGAYARAQNITYGGSQWTKQSNGIQVSGIRNDTQHLQVLNGTLALSVPATSALMISLNV